MIQTSVAASAEARLQPDIQESDLLDPLWRLAGDLHNSRALIIAEHGLDLMCGLIRRGCPAATFLRPGNMPDTSNYDVVFVPLAKALPSSDQLIRVARRALGPDGRLIAGVSGPWAGTALARRLRLNGFSPLRSVQLPGLMFLCADLRRRS